jgi:uncharacterized protein
MKVNQEQNLPWWQYGHVWLVIAGPVLVVIAALVTLGIAIAIPDPVVSDAEYRQGVELRNQKSSSGLTPAMQARNHAATGVSAGKTEHP